MKMIMKLSDEKNNLLKDMGILWARVALGMSMAFAHGMGEMQHFSEGGAKFPDPFGIGNEASMALAIFAEFFCGILLVLGLGTRLALTQLIATMGVAMYCHMSLWGDPLFASGGKSAELAFIYLIGFMTLLLTGPGRFSLDHLLVKKFAGEKKE